MESILLITLILSVFIAPLVISIVAIRKVNQLQRQLEKLLSGYPHKLNREVAKQPAPEEKVVYTGESSTPEHFSDIQADRIADEEAKLTTGIIKPDGTPGLAEPELTLSKAELTALASQPEWLSRALSHLKKHWLVWVGGLALLIGVAYLVEVISHYIEITPLMRIVAAFSGSCLVLALAERFHQREKSYASIGFAYIPAVISAAGCMGLYSTIIFSYIIYSFLPPVVSLLSMGAVSVFTLSLYLRFGPLMAVLGVLAGYCAPFWFLDQSSNGFGLAGYISFIALAGLLLATHVRKAWLFPLVLIPYYLWMLAIEFTVRSEILSHWSLLYLTLAIYFILGVPLMGWQLKTSYHRSVTEKTYNIVGAAVAVGLLVAISFYNQADTILRLLCSIYLTLLIAWLPVVYQKRTHSRYLSYTSVAIVLALLILLLPVSASLSDGLVISLLMVMVSLLMARSFIQHMCRPRDKYTKLLLLAAPVVLTGTGWWVIYDSYYDSLWLWGGFTVLVILGYSYFSSLVKPVQRHIYASQHVIVAIALSFLFSGTELTLMMAVQVACIAWQMIKTRYRPASWAMKLAVSAAILRATLMTVIPEWQTGAVDLSGMLLLFALLLGLFGFSYWLIKAKYKKLADWLEGTIMYLLVVTLFSQTHYWLFADVRIWDWDRLLQLSIVYSLQMLIVSAIYLLRAKRAERLKWLYSKYSELMFVLAAGLILINNTLLSPLINNTISADAPPLFNWLSMGWLLAAIILLCVNHYKLCPALITDKMIKIVSGVLLLLWGVMSIRQFWQDESMTLYVATSMAEQISYSLAGIITGVTFALYGTFRRNDHSKLIGLTILIVIMAKVFLVDTSELEGILRAISYLVLGGTLVGLGWLFQRINASRKEQG
ncbi:DUF2339 domain-containing protein [Vibrio sp. SCSIO 43137]|uniref:DUF2339 domain-containing protein n=1 Tax=Vibrio sp. SCSIO 43137 TaxID=3021011 RepID=UPI002307679E|nr:DUF2339 domain-containing protein [Vibrio sp. SCSIO 43137]WCE30611.1 DUF2339 domain-containing protein [Vibrio sp. SCSIO 43137]